MKKLRNAAQYFRSPHSTEASVPSFASTLVICVGLVMTWLILPTEDPDQMFRTAAMAVGLGLGVALILEAQVGIRTVLVRTDLLMLVALYGLTLFEFLFPQQEVTQSVSPEAAHQGIEAVLISFGAFAIGRHLLSNSASTKKQATLDSISARAMFRLLVVASMLGYFYMLLAVNFDVVEMLRQMSLPRFSQAWARGRLGDSSSLLGELALFIYLIPPMAGAVFAQRERYSLLQKGVVIVLLAVTLYNGFAGGTRSVFAVYIITFVVAFLALSPKLKLSQILMFSLIVAGIMLGGMYYMLEFRQIGLANYSFTDIRLNNVSVDYNIVVLSQLTEVFPSRHDYLGLEIPWSALTRPIPRALWPGKPEGLSFGIEDALGARGLTLSATFIGECYMSGGLFGVLLASLGLGVASGRWNRVGQDLSSNFRIIFYASGFFAAALVMRSILSVAPAVLPTIALWLYSRYRVRWATPSSLSAPLRPAEWR